MATKVTCPTCGGSGRVGKTTCQTCGGSGEVVQATKEQKKALGRKPPKKPK